MDLGRQDVYNLLTGRGEEEINERVRESLRDPASPLLRFVENYCAASARACNVTETVDFTKDPAGGGRRWPWARRAIKAASVLLVVGIMGAGGVALEWKSRLNRLEEEIKSLGLAEPVRFDEQKFFVNSGRNRVSVSGSANKAFVRRVLVTWYENQTPVTIYEGPPEPPPDGLHRYFSALSPEFELDYRIIEPTLTVEPYLSIERKLPLFFKQKRFSRSFLLGMDGIVPDPDVTTARSPVWLKIPSRPIHLRANDAGYEFGGVSRRDGWVVVLIRDDRPSNPWYVQNFGQPIRVEPGKPFTVPCTLALGVERFEIKAVMLRSLRGSPFAEQKEVLTIPSADADGQRLESTEAVKFTVIRASPPPTAGSPGEKSEYVDAAEILSPRPGATVDRIEILEGQTKMPGHPVVLVMPEADGQPWTVQAPVAMIEEGRPFTARIYCGADSTKIGTKFRIVIVLAKNKETAESYLEGTRIMALPFDLPKSKPITVSR